MTEKRIHSEAADYPQRASLEETKEPYYVSLTSRTIEKEPTAADQLSILASEAELAKLQLMLDELSADDDISSIIALIPFKSADHNSSNKQVQRDVTDLYRYIYNIGTEQTRSFLEESEMFRGLKNTDYDDPGYGKNDHPIRDSR